MYSSRRDRGLSKNRLSQHGDRASPARHQSFCLGGPAAATAGWAFNAAALHDMSIVGLAKFRAAVRKYWPRARPLALILLYHRIAEPATDPQLLSVARERFSQQMAHLARHYEVVSLQELVSRLRRNAAAGSRLAAVTFDDGYADNLSNAKPILESCKVPATVFVSTGFLENRSECWWDELEDLLLYPSSLPGCLELEIEGRRFEWTLGDEAAYRDRDFAAHKDWTVLRPDDPTSRHRIYRELCRLLRPLDEGSRQRSLRALRAWAGGQSERPCFHQMLTADGIGRLAAGPFVEVGAHTQSHPVLARLSVADQREEIGSSKKCLEGILGRSVRSFAYPYGAKSDYTEFTTALVKEEGFALACSNYPQPVAAGADVYQLPRFVVRNWTQERFIRVLESWWNGTGEPGCDQ
jgi:peptidoglycan/xylan/chitin deacetylase (PgdA/CDA1 family)